MEFNSELPKVMHIDINSCFATIEQQANPFLRGKPIAVAAFTTPRGCILAASVEAKKLGIKTGMRVSDGQKIFPALVVLPPDPWKYRNVHIKLKNLLSEYTNDIAPKSIDEFVLNFSALKARPLKVIAQEIKSRIKKEIGEWITVSIGIAPNRYLAKIAAGLKKPDGLTEINKNNYLDTYSSLRLTDLTGIKTANAARLSSVGIYTVLNFYRAPAWKLKAAFRSVTGIYWHQRLAGYEVDSVEYGRRSFGNSVALGRNLTKIEELSPILSRLVEKMSARLRSAGFAAKGIHLSLIYKNGSWWHKGRLGAFVVSDSRDFYRAAFRLLLEAKPASPVLNIAVSCFGLVKNDTLQLDLFQNIVGKSNLICAGDKINERWGEFTIGSARSFGGAKVVLDRIAFGGVKNL